MRVYSGMQKGTTYIQTHSGESVSSRRESSHISDLQTELVSCNVR